MDTNKIIDDIVVSLSFPHEEKNKNCLIVFSSRESHIEIAIDCIEMIIGKKYKYQVIRLDKYLSSQDSQYEEIFNIINECSIGVVILDGFRPNVFFEYGILKGLKKPCIVFKEINAKIDVLGFYKDIGLSKKIENPSIDMDKHFSDVKDRFYVTYDKNNPKEIREKVNDEMVKLKQQIEDEYIRMLIPNKDILITEIKNKLIRSYEIYEKEIKEISIDLRSQYSVLMNDIVDIAKENNILLPDEFFQFISVFFRKVTDYEESLSWVNKCTHKKLRYYNLKSSILTRQKNYKEALILIDEAIGKFSNIESLWHRKAIAHDSLGDRKKAEEAYLQGIRFNKGCSTLHFHFGILLYENNRFNEAYEQFILASKIKSSVRYSFWEAKSLIKKGDETNGKLLFKRLSKEYPEDADVWFEYGKMEKDNKTALRYFNKSIKADPNHSGSLCSKAFVLVEMRKFEQALLILKRIEGKCKRYKTCDVVQMNTGNILFKLKKYNEALIEINKSYKVLKGDSRYLAFRAVLFILTDKTKEGFYNIGKALKIDDTNANSYYNFACALSIKDKIVESIEYLKKAIEINNKFKEDLLTDEDLENVRESVNIKEIFEI